MASFLKSGPRESQVCQAEACMVDSEKETKGREGPRRKSGVKRVNRIRIEVSYEHSRSNQLRRGRSEEHTSELQSLRHLVCRLLLEKKKIEEIKLITDA